MSRRPLALLVLISSCGAPERVGERSAERGGIGAPCRRDGDCISGATCSYYSCDFKNPCSARIDAADGTSTRVYDYTPDGYELGWKDTRGGEVVAFERWGWSIDRRQAHVETYLGDLDEPLAVSDFEYDSDGEQRVLREHSRGTLEVISYAWSDAWSCRAPRVEVRDGAGALTFTTRATCAADGSPTRIEWVTRDGDVRMTKDSVFAEERLVERTSHYHVPKRPYAVRHVYHRDARGAVVGLTIDQGADGSVEQTEAYDLGCWVVEGGRVHYRP